MSAAKGEEKQWARRSQTETNSNDAESAPVDRYRLLVSQRYHGGRRWDVESGTSDVLEGGILPCGGSQQRGV